MNVYETTIWQDNLRFLPEDPDNPPVDLKFMSDEVLRAKFPYQVMIEAHLCTGPRFYEKRRFCDMIAPTLCKRIGAVRTDDVLYRIFAFGEPRHARYFHGRFGGVRYAMGRVVSDRYESEH